MTNVLPLFEYVLVRCHRPEDMRIVLPDGADESTVRHQELRVTVEAVGPDTHKSIEVGQSVMLRPGTNGIPVDVANAEAASFLVLVRDAEICAVRLEN